MLVSIGKLAKELGVSIDTIRNWENQSKINSFRTDGGHRRFDLEQVLAQLKNDKIQLKKITIGYARVSTANRKNDLQRQIQVIELFCAKNGWQYSIISDIGSGINYNKKGLKKLIELIETQQVERIVINYKDRLIRFGFELIEEICKLHNVEIIIISATESKTFEQEMVDDILSILTVFSAKLYGSRSHKNKKIVEEVKKLEEIINE